MLLVANYTLVHSSYSVTEPSSIIGCTNLGNKTLLIGSSLRDLSSVLQ